MTVIVAVPDSAEGRHALQAAAAEARRLGAGLVAVNLTAAELDTSALPEDVEVSVVDRSGRDPADAVLDEIDARNDADRLVICIRRRSPVGKAILGSISQRLLLDAGIPVLAVKLPEEHRVRVQT